MKASSLKSLRNLSRPALAIVACCSTNLLYAAEEQAASDMSAMPLSDPGYLLQVFVSLLVVLSAIFLLSLLLKKFDLAAPRAEGPIRVLHSVSLGGKEQLILVQVGKEQILVGRTPGQVAAIHMLEQPVSEIASEDQLSPTNGLLSRLFNRQLS